MKATIKFPDWIDEDEFEFVGYRGAQPNSGEYVLFNLEADCWSVTKWGFDHTSSYGFCFRKKQKFVWPECFADGTKIWFEPQVNDWQIKRGSSALYYITYINKLMSDKYKIDTVMLDKNKVYVKGED